MTYLPRKWIRACRNLTSTRWRRRLTRFSCTALSNGPPGNLEFAFYDFHFSYRNRSIAFAGCGILCLLLLSTVSPAWSATEVLLASPAGRVQLRLGLQDGGRLWPIGSRLTRIP